MIIRNTSFQNDLCLKEDHFHTISVASPRLYSRIVQSFLNLANGEEPIERFMLIEKEVIQKASALLYVITDPFAIDVNNRKFLTMLYDTLEKELARDTEKYHRWRMHMIEACEILTAISDQLIPDVVSIQDISVSEFARVTKLMFDIPGQSEVKTKLYSVMEIFAEFCHGKILVLSGLLQCLTQEDWKELMKYACYLKVSIVDIEREMSHELESQEIRWCIQEDYEDIILQGE